ncbi:hypothetical protein T484DRAFT_2563757 [Baffinella frigidus]|nr:hypothetical protein T484DRAFT_2563757 [Cryptophyta sp. CCMP2293]
MQESGYKMSGPFMAGWGGHAYGQDAALDCGLLKGEVPAQGSGYTMTGATAQGAMFDALGFDMGDAKAVVSAEAPFTLLRASQEWLDLFRFSREEVHGRSLRVIQGPCTDGRKLAAVVQAAANGKSAEDSIMLYSSAGQGIIVNVKSASVGDGRQQAVLLTMRPSDALPLKTALDHVAHSQDEACTILQINAPHSVEQISPGFTRSYGVTGEQMQRRTLRVIMGPLSDLNILTALFKSCSKGLARTAHMYTARIDCTEMYVRIKAVPLFSSPGTITHMMVSFSAAEANSYWMHDEHEATPSGWTGAQQVEPQHADMLPSMEAQHLPAQRHHHQLPHRAQPQLHQDASPSPMLHHHEHRHHHEQPMLAQPVPACEVEEPYESALRAQMNAGTPVSFLAKGMSGMGVQRAELESPGMMPSLGEVPGEDASLPCKGSTVFPRRKAGQVLSPAPLPPPHPCSNF